jgi:N12 class adenine-specific DNA methylase
VLDRLIGDLRAVMEDLPKEEKRTRKQIEQRIEQLERRFGARTGRGQGHGRRSRRDGRRSPVRRRGARVPQARFRHQPQQREGHQPRARKALDLYIKIKALEEINPGRSHTFASGTPVTNTLGELYSRHALHGRGRAGARRPGRSTRGQRSTAKCDSFDERNAAGKYEVVERFAKFVNVPELMSRCARSWTCSPSSQLGRSGEAAERRRRRAARSHVAALRAQGLHATAGRAHQISRAWKPSKDEPGNPDPLINIITDGRLAAIDMRFVYPGKRRPAAAN